MGTGNLNDILYFLILYLKVGIYILYWQLFAFFLTSEILT